MHAGDRRRRQQDGSAEVFGRLLRFYRQRERLSLERVGAVVGYSKSQVAMVERGERPPRGEFIAKADMLLRAEGALIAAGEGVQPSSSLLWFDDFLEEEQRATVIHSYQVQALPGLLQTRDYARAVLLSYRPAPTADAVEERLAKRLARAKLLHRTPPVDAFTFIIEETALRRPLGGVAVLREALLNLLDIGALPNVDIHVMPTFAEEHAGLDGSLMLLDMQDRTQAAFLEWQDGHRVERDPETLSRLHVRYGSIRAQALNSKASTELIHGLAREP